jgi:hypothetical protein
MFYNVSRNSIKSGDKLKKAIERYVALLKKEAKEATKWVYKTKIKADARLKRYGITKAMIQKALEKKGLKDLLK